MIEISTENKLVPKRGQSQSKSFGIVFLLPQRLVKFLVLTEIVLLAANLAGFLWGYILPGDSLIAKALFNFFNFDREQNIPAYFSTVLLLFISALLFLTYLLKKSEARNKGSRHWLFLSLVFLFLSVDENIQIHEPLGRAVKGVFPTGVSDYILWAWVLPYALLFLGVAAYLSKFVLSLPKRTRNLFILSGLLYVAGAIGLDVLQGQFHSSMTYNRIFYTIEELMEMMGAILFIHALLQYLAGHNA